MKHKLIGLYQLITGIFGVILLIFKFIQGINANHTVLTDLLGILLFAGVAYAGYGLLNKISKAVQYSFWAQALQILSFTFGKVHYLFAGSYFLSIGYNEKLGIDLLNKLIDFDISVHSINSPLEIKIFIVPVILVFLLAKK